MYMNVLKRMAATLGAGILTAALSLTQLSIPSVVTGGAAAIAALTAMTSDSDARNRSGGARHVSSHSGQRNVNRSGNRNVNRNVDRNVNRNINRNVNVHSDWDRHHYHPVARGVAVGVTAAAVGSVVYGLPGGCRTVVVNGIGYRDCGNVWYAPRYQGSQVVYVVVNQP